MVKIKTALAEVRMHWRSPRLPSFSPNVERSRRSSGVVDFVYRRAWSNLRSLLLRIRTKQITHPVLLREGIARAETGDQDAVRGPRIEADAHGSVAWAVANTGNQHLVSANDNAAKRASN